MFVFAKLIHKIFRLNAIRNTKISRKAKLCYDIQMMNSSLDDYSYIGEKTIVINTAIGKFCSIADNCIIGAPEHNYNYFSTSPIFEKGHNIFNKNFATNSPQNNSSVVIKNDVWIGSGVLIKSGITLGNGCIIGMGSVVTHDVPDYEIWAGNPARKIKNRFDLQKTDFLLKSKWWDMNEKDLSNFICDYMEEFDK